MRSPGDKPAAKAPANADRRRSRRMSSKRPSRSTSSSSPIPISSTTASGSRVRISSASGSWCRSPTTAISSPTRSTCWPAATISSGCAAAAPRRGRSSSSTRSSARPQTRYSAEEHALQEKLKATETKLAELTGKDQDDTPAICRPSETQGDRAIPRRHAAHPPRSYARCSRRCAGHRPARRTGSNSSTSP